MKPARTSCPHLALTAVRSNSVAGAILKQFVYGYDNAGNRTSEQIKTGSGVSVVGALHNNLNQLVSRSAGGPMRFKGSLNEPGTVTVAGSPATMDVSNRVFTGYANVAVGTNTVAVVATDYSNNSRTNNYQVVVTNGAAAMILSYDANGNCVLASNATSVVTYEWDGVDRLIAVNKGSQRSEFTYDGLSRRIRIVEKQNGSTVSDKRFVWCETDLCEERDASGATVAKRFFGQGEQVSGTNYFYSRDHLGSVRELTDSGGSIRARYDYDPYGRRSKISGDLDADFGYTGQYCHTPSGLLLALFRAYDAERGVWLSRDPIEEDGGINLYAYVIGDPLGLADPFGLDWLNNLSDSAAGFGDSLSFGLTERLRERMGINDVVNKCDGFYGLGRDTQVAMDWATIGVSGGLKLAARGVSTAAARKAGRKFLKEAPGQIRHHRFPLAGHPGGGTTLFPTKGLPASIHSGPGNIAVVGEAGHALRHASFRAAEGALGVNSALAPARLVNNANRGRCD